MRSIFYSFFIYYAYWIKRVFSSNGLCILFVLYIASQNLSGNVLEFHGQSAGWTEISQNTSSIRWGLRFIPRVNATHFLHKKYQIDLEASLNTYYAHETKNVKVKPYRVWTRLSKSNLEIRLGLQQINFGSASLFRPLMWFDRVDPRDPLRMTDGVYGLLSRYYFMNNKNLWTWILLDNQQPKGWELFGTSRNKPEWGGRIQMPLPKGEMALTLHQREAKVRKSMHDPPIPVGSHEEFRVGLEAKWDIGPGIWFEESFIHRDILKSRFRNQHLFTLGTDYTFSLGHGLYVLTEHLVSHSGEEPFGSGKTTQFSAFMADYPVGLTDRISGILFLDWKNKNLYRFFTWQKTTDQWSFYVMLFWNPKVLFLPYHDTSSWFGKGGQFLIAWHF